MLLVNSPDHCFVLLSSRLEVRGINILRLSRGICQQHPVLILLVNSIKLLGRPVGGSRQQKSSDASWPARFLIAKLRPVLHSTPPPWLDAASAFLPGRHSVLAVVRSRVRPETWFPLRPPAGRRVSGTPQFSPAVVRVGELRAVLGR